MRELIDSVAQHPAESFWIGVFALIGIAIICHAVVKSVRGYPPCEVAEPTRCQCGACVIDYNPAHDAPQKGARE